MSAVVLQGRFVVVCAQLYSQAAFGPAIMSALCVALPNAYIAESGGVHIAT